MFVYVFILVCTHLSGCLPATVQTGGYSSLGCRGTLSLCQLYSCLSYCYGCIFLLLTVSIFFWANLQLLVLRAAGWGNTSFLPNGSYLVPFPNALWDLQGETGGLHERMSKVDFQHPEVFANGFVEGWDTNCQCKSCSYSLGNSPSFAVSSMFPFT